MKTPRIDFVGRSRQWAIVSAALILISLGALGIRGLDLAMDFVGGSSYDLIDIRDDVTSQELREAAEGAGAEDVTAQLQLQDEVAIGAVVRTASLEPGSEMEQAVRNAVTEEAQAEETAFEFVGPTWGQRVTMQALQALLVFLVVIIIYISVRLEFKMAIAAVVSLVHDLVITIGLYALVGFSVSPATVIAMLTILGYSLYDTVVVFDRVKENSAALGEPGRRTYPELVNSSMNEVVYRSLSTSISSLLPVGALLLIGASLLGASTLQDLALAMFIGMAVGIYSSLFVAAPLYSWLKLRDPEARKRVEKVNKSIESGEIDADEPKAAVAEAADGSPESRAPITTDYVRGQGKAKKRRKKR